MTNPLTTTEAAALADRTRRHMTFCARTGVIKAFKVGRDWHIDREDFERWLKSERKTGPKQANTN